MATRTPSRTRQVRSTRLHYPNETNPVLDMESDSEVRNNFSAERLYTPEELKGGDTHTPTEGGKAQPRAKLMAAVDDDLPNDSHNISTIDNDIDPTEGYDIEAADGIDIPDEDLDELEDGEADDLDGPEDDEDDEDGDTDEDEGEEIDASDSELLTPGAPSNLLVADEEWDPEDMLDEEQVEDGESMDAEDEDGADIQVESSDDQEILDLVDVDEVPDDQGDDVVFASMGSRVLALFKSRVIASLTKKAAVTAGVADEMHSDEFVEAATAEMKRQGIRAGLKSLGFVMATVNFSKAATSNRRVQAKVAASTKAVRKVYADRQKELGQAMAIAATGVNRGFWNDVPNELKASLVNDLQAAGVRNAAKVVNRVFAAHGIAYTKSIVDLANKIVEMPAATRNSLAAALDMVKANTDELDDLDDVLDTEEQDLEAVATDEAFGDDSDFVEASYDVPSTSVVASLARPIEASRDVGALLQPRRKVSIGASAILNGDRPLRF